MTDLATWDDPVVTWDDARFSWTGERLRLAITFVLPSETIDAVLRRSHRPVTRIEFLSADLNTVEATLRGYLLDGPVVTDRKDDAYSSANLRFVNVGGMLTAQSAESLVWPGRIVRVSRGALVNGAPVLFPLITGIVADPTDRAFSAEVGFRLDSRFGLARRKFSGPVTIAAGMRGRDAIRTLAELGGLGTSDALYALDDGRYTVPVARTFDKNEEILGAMVKFAFDMGCDLWPRGDGVTVMRPFVDPSTEAVVWDFSAGNLLSRERSVTTRKPVNRQVVYGRAPDGYEIRGEAKITNPAHPFFWTAARDFPAEDYVSPDVNTVEVANAVAVRLLTDAQSYDEAFDVQAVPDPRVAAGDIAAFSGGGYSDGFLLERVTIPTWHGAMAMSSQRTRSLG